jgi:ribose/xylose/arabinose/galactoside ABC-type transport system permease subunit
MTQDAFVESPDPVLAVEAAPGVSGARRALAFVMRNALPFGFVAMIAIFIALGAPNMLSFANIRDVLRLSTPILVVAIPMSFLLIMKHVDLSVGSAAGLSAVAAGVLFTKLDQPALVGGAAGLLVGALIGFTNGYLVNVVRLSPIIVTLGGLTGLRGLALALAPFPIFGFPDEFVQFGVGGVLGVPYVVIVAVVVVLVGAFTLALSPIGRHVLAIGVNEEAAYVAGVNVRRHVWGAYLLTGLAAGLAGVMYAAQFDSTPAGVLGVGFELDVLTAVMLGGVAFDGGRGTIRGVVLGVLFLAMLQNGLGLLNVPAAISLVIKGFALVVAATLDRATVKALLVTRER